jgi:hypothetical protein
MTPVAGVSPIVFRRYNDDLKTFDDVINGLREIWYSAYSNTGFDFPELGRTGLNFYNSRFDRIEESFCGLSIKVNRIAILFSSFRIVSVFH